MTGSIALGTVSPTESMGDSEGNVFANFQISNFSNFKNKNIYFY